MNNSNPINSSRLFLASCLALITTAMTFAIRARLMGPWGAEFNLTNEEVGWVASTAFWGFTISMVLGGPLVDVVGMRLLTQLAFLGHLAGISLTLFANDYNLLFMATLIIGIANGMVEAVCNPLVTSIYPDEKTKFLNRFHIWFPGGIVIGGLLAYVMMDSLNLPWRWLMAGIAIPNLIYGMLFLNQKFPKTERVSSGVSYAEMVKSSLGGIFVLGIFIVLWGLAQAKLIESQPLGYAIIALGVVSMVQIFIFKDIFTLIIFCMLLTAGTELGTGQWIDSLLKNVGVPAILLLVFINGIMAIGRYFAGGLVHRLAPEGILTLSAVVATGGLLFLSFAEGPIAFVAAGVFAIGVCYFWPTMLGFVSEYIPKSGTLGLSLMGGAGMLSVSLLLPYMGHVYDHQLMELTQFKFALDALKNPIEGTVEAVAFQEVSLKAGAATLRWVTILPAFLILAFSLVVWFTGSNKSKKIR